MKQALCMGINDYPGTDCDLAQCLNDMHNMVHRLQRVGFNVVELSNEFVTAKNFVSYASNMIRLLSAGDEFVITYSGHGSYQLDLSGDEADGYDEVICLWDRDFTDDEFRQLLDTVPSGVKTTIILDSCFSGTATRAYLSGKVRKVRFRPPKAPLVPFFTCKKKFLKSSTMDEEQSMNHVLLSGCSDNQYSYETEGQGGAFTSALCTILDKAPQWGLTFEQFQVQMTRYLPSRSFPQNPQVEGSVENKCRLMPFFKETQQGGEEPDDGGPAEEEPTEDEEGNNSGGCSTAIAGFVGVVALILYILLR